MCDERKRESTKKGVSCLYICMRRGVEETGLSNTYMIKVLAMSLAQ
jgi:hypothetical protein